VPMTMPTDNVNTKREVESSFGCGILSNNFIPYSLSFAKSLGLAICAS